MMRHACKIVGFFILLLYSVDFAAGEETEKATRSWDEYKIITERNIFSRYRTKTVPMSQIPQQVVVVPEQSYYTLRGIIKQSDGFISFIEDSRTASVTRFRKGDSIADGRVTGISMDHISYENEGKTIKVEIGMNLEGQASGAGMQYLSSGFGRIRANGGFPITAQSQGMGQMPAMGQQGQPGGVTGQTGGQAPGTGQMPGMGQSQTEGMFQGRGQGPAMGQFQPTGQGAAAGQAQSIGQAQGMGRMQATGTVQSAGQSGAAIQPQSAGQVQTVGQSGATGQLQTTVNSSGLGQAGASTAQPVTGTQPQAADSDDIVQRLKERRKKELE